MPHQHNFTNAQVADQLRHMAAAYEVEGADFFRVRAYQNAAESIDHLGANLSDLWEQNRLDEVAGLGESLTSHLDELFRTGKVKHFDQVKKKLPAGMFALLGLPEVGPKTAFKLAKELKLTTARSARSKLLTAARQGRLAEIEGIGPKTAAMLMSVLTQKHSAQEEERLFLPDAAAIAQDVMAFLQTIPAVKETAALGSLRRRSATVGDIDIGVKSEHPAVVLAHLHKFDHVRRWIASGENTASFIHRSGKQVDVKIHQSRGWGSMLQHYTGSKAHNIHLRTLAKEKGLSLSEYGIKKGERLNYFTDETDFYQALGMTYIPPELREDAGEIEAAQKHQLPQLLDETMIKGDLHLHSNLDWPSSHDIGESSLTALFDAAMAKGYQYLGISDHQPKATGLSVADRYRFVQRRNEQIDRALEKWQATHPSKKFYVLKGLEVDIRPDGSLALEDRALDLLDYTVVSIHSAFNQSKSDATRRIKQALQHPKATIWGHPTGRLIRERQGLSFDWEEIWEVCARQHKIIEINASPWRLDLPDSLVRLARERGLRLAINTDAHAVAHLDFMRYGVWVARRGWLPAEAVINTLTWTQLRAAINQVT